MIVKEDLPINQDPRRQLDWNSIVKHRTWQAQNMCYKPFNFVIFLSTWLVGPIYVASINFVVLLCLINEARGV